MTSSPRARVLATCLGCAALAALALILTFSAQHAGASAEDAGDHFAVLNTPAGSGDDTLFSQVQELAGPGSAISPDLESARSRVATVEDGERDVSVASGAGDTVCLAYRATGSSGPILATCSSIDAAAAHGLISVSHAAPGAGVNPDTADVTALVPDGVSTVTLGFADAPDVDLDVTDNTVAAEVDAPTTLSFTDDDGTTTVDLTGAAS
ncbi:MAG TPA: hypothetical protein VHZ31_00990 [Solirubrobacteraceae bacterium]|nr:hypothetical protein [Solirubrobacteraceae bacterium]